LVQAKNAVDVTATSITATFDSTPTQNNLLVSVLGASGGIGTITQPTGWTMVTGTPLDSAGNSPNSGGRPVACAWKIAGAGESSAVTWSGNSNAMSCSAIEVSGLVTSSPVDQVTAAAFSNSVVSSLNLGTTGTTTVANEVAIAFCVDAARTGQSLTNGFTLVDADGSRAIMGYKILSATGTVQTTAAWTSGTSTCAGGIVTFKGL